MRQRRERRESRARMYACVCVCVSVDINACLPRISSFHALKDMYAQFSMRGTELRRN